MTDDIIILVEFDEAGVRRTARGDEADPIADTKSREAIERALKVISWVGDKAHEAIKAAHHQPDEAELEFGIKIGTKAGIIVTQADAEFHIKARLVWKNAPRSGADTANTKGTAS